MSAILNINRILPSDKNGNILNDNSECDIEWLLIKSSALRNSSTFFFCYQPRHMFYSRKINRMLTKRK